MKIRKSLLLSGLAAFAALMAVPAQAFCGFYAGKADASLFNEASQVAIARDGNRTVLSMQNDYKGPLSEFVLIVPTPVVLKEGQVRIVDKSVFSHLDAYSSPRLVDYNDPDPCPDDFESKWWDTIVQQVMISGSKYQSGSSIPALGVTVEAKYAVGEYDIVILSAKQSDGLETWLKSNGYKIPPGASAALKPYVNQGMKFFIAKVNLKEQLKTGFSNLRPLQFAFESEKFMLPMRLGMLNAAPGKAQDLIVYLMTRNGRVESSNYRTMKVPANLDLPGYIRPKFLDVYKAAFDKVSAAEDYRVVFTEYFWNMQWCDPCVAQPLTGRELSEAGVFWAEGDAQQNFNDRLHSANTKIGTDEQEGKQYPVMLTRLHVRYTPRTFPEDLMFTETQDGKNWQSRYVLHNAFKGSVAACSEKMSGMDCKGICKKFSSNGIDEDCLSSCLAYKKQGAKAAEDYFNKQLPERAGTERWNLSELTGWSAQQIDAIPGALPVSSLSSGGERHVSSSESPATNWWQSLFAK